ncbi:MAG: S8 family serine peptidase [Acidobacteriota bacterium]|nr:S8 family serine peptidase [Acidobacteriota bacterium]
MKRIVLAAVALFLATTAFAADTHRYLVATKRPIANGGLRAVRDSVDSNVEFRSVDTFQTFDGFAATLTEEEVRQLRASREVRFVEPVVPRYALDVERNFAGQTVPYGVDAISARQAGYGHRSGLVNVAVIDTGIDFTHAELSGVYMGGMNVVDPKDPTLSPLDDHGHGTHVSGTIAAADNNFGVIGVAPGVRLWAVKALASNGSGTSEGIIRAIDWVVAKKKEVGGNWVVNMSLGSSQESGGEREAFQRAFDAGLIVVAASGNSSTVSVVAPVGFPAAYPTVVAVGAYDSKRKLASFTSQGPELDFSAPGVSVLSTMRVGSAFRAFVADVARSYAASPLAGSNKGTVKGDYVFCGYGAPSDFAGKQVAGKIALIKRGMNLTFAAKTRAAKAAGAAGVVIFNNDLSTGGWTLLNDEIDQAEAWPVVLRLSMDDGEALAAKGSGPMTLSYDSDDYGELSGTSMACPHVTGSIALLWMLAPNATRDQILNALTVTALDLGAPGPDTQFGAGAINVFAAAKMLVPSAFATTPTTGRTTGRRR